MRAPSTKTEAKPAPAPAPSPAGRPRRGAPTARQQLRAALPAMLALVFFCALATALFAPIVGAQRFLTWDVPEQYWPDLQYLCGSLWSGEWPLWNPFDRGGYPFHADPQNGMYYPLNWALCAVGGPAPRLGFAEFRAVFHFALAGSLMCGFLRALGLGWGASVLGGVAFMTAPFQRRMWEVNTAYTIAWLPGLWWTLERLVQRPNGKRAALVALTAAAAVSVGSPPALYFTVVGASVYALLAAARERRVGPYLLLAGGLATLLCAVALWPTFELSQHSVQSGTDYAGISAGGYQLRDLAGVALPRDDVKYLYLGIPALLLAAWGLVAARDIPLSLRLTLLGLALYALLMTLGDHFVLYRLAFRAVPGVSAFRAPVRNSALLGVSVAALAAFGADYLPKAKYTAWVALLALAASVYPALPRDRDAREGPAPGDLARLRAFAARAPGLGTDARFYDEFGVALRAGTRARLRELRGYQDPLQLARFARVVGKLHEFPRVLEQFNVRYLLRGPHFLHGTEHHFLPAGHEARFADDRGDGLWETREPLAAAYWVPRALVLPSADDALWRVRRTAPARVALLEQDSDGSEVPLSQNAPPERELGPAAVTPGDGGEPATPARFRAATSVRVGRNEVTLEVETPAGGWLVLNEVFYPGWRAWVDGQEALVRRANYLVRAVEIPGAGVHRVRFEYAPQRYWTLLGVAGVGLLLSLWLLSRRETEFGAE